MIEKGRICISLSLCLLTLTLIFHLVAMGYSRWKIYEHRTMVDKTVFIGIFHRCEHRLVNIMSNLNKTYTVCDDNKYYFHGNSNCTNLQTPDNTQSWCNLRNNSCNCDYSSITKGLISCTIISACTLGISLLLIFSHILINQFKYKIHMYISMVTLPFLFLGFIFILITLILFGSTLSYDLYQYRYNLNNRLALLDDSLKETLRNNITNKADTEYNIRLDWAGGLEIGALLLSCLTIVIQIIYLISTYRNRIG